MKCLNCGTEVTGNFCPNCGQKASTKRFSLKRLLDREFLNGAFMLNKGLLFTLKTLFTRPGHGVREFVEGKRVRYFNAFSLLLLILALMFFLDGFSDLSLSDVLGDGDQKEIYTSFEKFMEEYPRLIFIINIPIMAFSTFIFFKKSKVNFAEHIILNTYNSSASLVLSLPFSIVFIFYDNLEKIRVYYQASPILSVAYSIWLYYQFFSTSTYKKSSLIWRSLFAILLFFLLQGISSAILIGVTRGFPQPS
ncbi:MAG: DUF3667 domain-containing protein [Bacteroidota bacterium]